MKPPDIIEIPDAPALPGLVFRRFRDEADYAQVVALMNACHSADQIDQVETLESLTNFYASIEAFDPYRDLLFVEMEGRLIGHSQIEWVTDTDNVQFYLHASYLLPQWRGQGIGRAILHYNEAQLRAIAATQPANNARFFETTTADTEVATERLLHQEGYKPGRYFYKMQRLLAKEIPPAPLPAGLEIRPVQFEHYRLIWEANDEAFHDHWSHVSPTEADYQAWLKEPDFEPELWQIAWAGDQVAGVAINVINRAENARLGYQRAKVNSLSVRRPWRRQGLARALLVDSFHLLKERGVADVILFVDTENQSGALGLYESVGFEVVKQFTAYHKEVNFPEVPKSFSLSDSAEVK